MRAEPQVAYLAGLAGAETEARVRGRLGIKDERREKEKLQPWQRAYELRRKYSLPASALLWMLERDDPEINAVVFCHTGVDGAIRRDILRGVPFGPGCTGRLEVSEAIRRAPEPEIPYAAGPQEVIRRLRSVRTMGQGRTAALAVERARGDWEEIAKADREQPLPGYARWALSLRLDCPPELRGQFGRHRKFEHRQRQAGIVSGPREYVEEWRPAHRVLATLDLGRELFPHREKEAGEVLRPLVRDELGDDTEAWAVLAQLLPTFSGTLPELITTVGAIMYGRGAA